VAAAAADEDAPVAAAASTAAASWRAAVVVAAMAAARGSVLGVSRGGAAEGVPLLGVGASAMRGREKASLLAVVWARSVCVCW